MFSCLSFRDFEQNILINYVHFHNFSKNCSIESWSVSYEKGIRIVNLKSKTSLCHRTNLYFVFNMSIYRKPEIQNENHQNVDQNSLTILILAFQNCILRNTEIVFFNN